MNYRQWKKKYKKEHGFNPPLEDDKRKQRKIAKKALKQVNEIDIQETVNRIVKDYINMFADFFKILGEALINASDNLRIE